jgi:hypothetical protein
LARVLGMRVRFVRRRHDNSRRWAQAAMGEE